MSGRCRRRPPNFLWVYSHGVAQGDTLNPAVDRVADVFPDEIAIADAGWSSQEASDLLAVLGLLRLVDMAREPHSRRLPTVVGRRFSERQAEVDAEHTTRRDR